MEWDDRLAGVRSDLRGSRSGGDARGLYPGQPSGKDRSPAGDSNGIAVSARWFVLDFVVGLRSYLVAVVVGARWRLASWIFLSTAFLALAVGQLAFVNRYAVNVMFWDQWDFYHPAFLHQGIWTAFDEQFGPHRQGVGFLLALLIDRLTGWNSRGDAFAASALIIAAAALAVLLARRCGIRASLALLGVPLLFFTLRQFEHFVGATNLSHATMPLVLIMLYGHALFLRSGPKRSLVLGILVFFMLFTGFAQLAGYVAIVIASY